MKTKVGKTKYDNKGITLVALVITIIVLLILAGVSIAMLTGENGVLTKASNSAIKNDNSAVVEGVKLKIQDYTIRRNIGEIEGVDNITMLQNDSILASTGIVNVEKLLNQKINTGNGIDNSDVYKIENNHLYYYDKDGNKTDLGEISGLQETDYSELFVVNDAGVITLKDYDSYYKGEKQWTLETLVIPSKVGDKTVKIIGQLFSFQNAGKSNLKKLIIQEGIEEIAFSSFSGCSELKEITLPSTLKTLRRSAFENCTSVESINIPSTAVTVESSVFINWKNTQTINIPFKEGNLPKGWDSNWNYACSANIVYSE